MSAVSAEHKGLLGMHEVLTGSMAAQYGSLPVIPLPQDEDLLIKFVRQMGIILSDKGIYRRGSEVVLANSEFFCLNIFEVIMHQIYTTNLLRVKCLSCL
jgi:hypothetical protein